MFMSSTGLQVHVILPQVQPLKLGTGLLIGQVRNAYIMK